MIEELGFRDIVTRSGMDAQTAQYVLKHPEHVSGMPHAGSQGRHRTFNLRQALRLALSAYLVQAGVPLKQAGGLVSYCEQVARKGFLYGSDKESCWLLSIYDARYAVCERCESARVESAESESSPIRIPFTTRQYYYDMKTGDMRTLTAVPIMCQMIDLTALELRIGKGA